MPEEKIYKVPPALAKSAWIDSAKYREWYRQSVENPEKFWAAQAQHLNWIKRWIKVKNTSFEKGKVRVKWFEGGKLNVSSNCIDRHLKNKADKTAIIWEGDDSKESKKISYRELYSNVCKFANVLKKHGVKKGDRVVIYLPMIPEAAFAMLACARIGAVHSVVFAGFSSHALKGRIEDSGAELLITADEGLRGGKKIPLKNNVDEAITGTNIKKVIVVKRTGGAINFKPGIDVWYHDEILKAEGDCIPELMDAEDPLFILYTSGSTGKPKGALHTSGGYLLFTALTHKYVFDYRDGDIYWCTADVGWVTGHSYIIYGPLCNGATTLMFEGIPNYPDFSRFWQVVDKYKVNIFYTAPTAIRALMKEGDEWVKKTSRKSLRILGSVGEPINPAAWEWYYQVVGDSRCPLMDTWWQTETGGLMITPLPGATDLKPGSAALPFFGVCPVIVNEKGGILHGAAEGYLCIADSWPGQMRTIFGDHKRFEETYFSHYPGLYFSGDGAKRDKDGYYWISGRVDDVINVSGHRLGTAEIESALVSNEKVAEAAVVGYPHDIKGQGIYAFVILKSNVILNGAKNLDPSPRAQDDIKKELVQHVRKEISAIATPDLIQIVSGLPKTRSGKIMRRILRKIAENDYANLGDTGTLTNPEIVDELVKGRMNK